VYDLWQLEESDIVDHFELRTEKPVSIGDRHEDVRGVSLIKI